HERDQFVMVDVFKELFYVDIYYPLKAIIHVFQYFLYRHLTTSVRAKAIAVFTKQRLIDWGQHLRDGLLDKSIHHLVVPHDRHTKKRSAHINGTSLCSHTSSVHTKRASCADRSFWYSSIRTHKPTPL